MATSNSGIEPLVGSTVCWLITKFFNLCKKIRYLLLAAFSPMEQVNGQALIKSFTVFNSLATLEAFSHFLCQYTHVQIANEFRSNIPRLTSISPILNSTNSVQWLNSTFQHHIGGSLCLDPDFNWTTTPHLASSSWVTLSITIDLPLHLIDVKPSFPGPSSCV